MKYGSRHTHTHTRTHTYRNHIYTHISTHICLCVSLAVRVIAWCCLPHRGLDTLGIEPRAFRMRSGCDTTTPCAQDDNSSVVCNTCSKRKNTNFHVDFVLICLTNRTHVHWCTVAPASMSHTCTCIKLAAYIFAHPSTTYIHVQMNILIYIYIYISNNGWLSPM